MAQRATIWELPSTPARDATVRQWGCISPDGTLMGGGTVGSNGIIRKVDASEPDFLIEGGFNIVTGFSYCSDKCIATNQTDSIVLRKTGPGLWEQTILPPPEEGGQGTAVAAISGDGAKIIGTWEDADFHEHAILWTDGVPQDLGVPDDGDGIIVQGRYISSDGSIVVGSASTSGDGSDYIAHVWTQAGGWETLQDYASARGVDLSGYIVRYGICVSANGRHFVAQTDTLTVLYIVLGDPD